MKKLSDETLLDKYLSGIEKLSKYVGATLGPKGKNIILKSGKEHIITKDGVTVAKFLDLEDPFENLAVQIVKESSIKTSTQAGDGTTTTIVLADSIYRNALKHVNTLKISPVLLKREIDKLVDKFVSLIDSNSLPITNENDLENIARISSNNDEKLGKLISEAFSIAGNDGAIKIENSKDQEDSLEVTEGYQLFSGYISSTFINDKTNHVATYNNPLIAISDENIESIEQILDALKLAINANRPLVIIANSIEDTALASLVANQLKGSAKVLPINAPKYFNDVHGVLQDLATMLGAKLMNPLEHKSISDITFDDFGTCEKITTGKNTSIFVGCQGLKEDIKSRIELLNSQIIDNSDLHECEILQERISRMSGCVVTIKIGAPTEVERNEKFYRIEDAVEAVRSSIENGILPGGGISLIKIFKKIPQPKNVSSIEHVAYKILEDSIKEPLRKMLTNAGNEDINSIFYKLLNSRDFNLGYDIYNERYCDMVKSGIIDPVKVIKSALINSVSVATMLLTSDNAIVEL